MKRVFLLCLVVVFLFSWTSCKNRTPIETAQILQYNADGQIEYNGNRYIHADTLKGWRTYGAGRRIGVMKEWGGNLSPYSFEGTDFDVGVYVALGDPDEMVLMVCPPEIEFEGYYIRSDFEIPELQADEIKDFIITLKSYQHEPHELGDIFIDRNAILKDLVLALQGENQPIDRSKLIGQRITILLSSEQMPGFYYEISIYELENQHFWMIDSGGNVVEIPELLYQQIFEYQKPQ